MYFVFTSASYTHRGVMLLLKNKTGLMLYIAFAKLQRASCPSVRTEELDSY